MVAGRSSDNHRWCKFDTSIRVSGAIQTSLASHQMVFITNLLYYFFNLFSMQLSLKRVLVLNICSKSSVIVLATMCYELLFAECIEFFMVIVSKQAVLTLCEYCY